MSLRAKQSKPLDTERLLRRPDESGAPRNDKKHRLVEAAGEPTGILRFYSGWPFYFATNQITEDRWQKTAIPSSVFGPLSSIFS
ncbi:MAG TPA: hypothetical protein VIK28_09080 [Sedimentisphaerales bacterium]